MKRIADYESEDKSISIRPNVLLDNKEPKLTHVTIFTKTSKIDINNKLISEVIEILKELEQRYIKKTL